MKKRASIFLEFSKIYFLLNKLDIHLLLLLNFNKPHFKIFLRYLNIHFILTGQSLRACVLRCFCHVQLFVTLWTVVHQDPLSMGFSRPEYWRGLPSSRGSSLPRDQTRVSYMSCIGRRVLYHLRIPPLQSSGNLAV